MYCICKIYQTVSRTDSVRETMISKVQFLSLIHFHTHNSGSYVFVLGDSTVSVSNLSQITIDSLGIDFDYFYFFE